MKGVDPGQTRIGDGMSVDTKIKAYRLYNYGIEIPSLIVRIFLTVAIEVAVALLFKINRRNQLLLLIGVNTVTQIILNILLNLTLFNFSGIPIAFYYALFELLIIFIEIIAYCSLMNRWTDKPKKNWFYAIYAITANLTSFTIGLIIYQAIPGIF